MKNKQKIIYLFIIISMYLFILQDLISQYFSYFKYFDELYCLLIIPVSIYSLAKNNTIISISKTTKKIIMSLLVIVIVGFIGNIRYKYQDYGYAFQDFILFIKFYVAFFMSKMILSDNVFNDNKNKILSHLKIIIVGLFLFSVYNVIFKVYLGDMRYGLMSNRIFYSHPTIFCAVCVFLLSFYYYMSEKKFDLYIVLILLMVFSTLRIKAIAFLIVAFALIFSMSKIEKIRIKNLLIPLIIIVLVGLPQFRYYFANSTQARNRLLIVSLDIAKNCSPIGTGFGTFGTYISGVHYSPLYYNYGLNNIWGLGVNGNFISDTFWPAIIAQFGYLGTIIYIYIIYLLYKDISEYKSDISKKLYISKLICLLYLLISSTSESAFYNPISIPLALIIGIAYKEKVTNE